MKNTKLGYFFLCFIPCFLFLIFSWNAIGAVLLNYDFGTSFPIIAILITAIILSIEDLIILWIFPHSRYKTSNNIRELLVILIILLLVSYLGRPDPFPNGASIGFVVAGVLYWTVFSTLHHAIQSRVQFHRLIEPILATVKSKVDVGQDWQKKEALESNFYEIESHRQKLKSAHTLSSVLLWMGIILSIVLYDNPFVLAPVQFILGIVSFFFILILRFFTRHSLEDHLYVPQDLLPNQKLHSRRAGISVLLLLFASIVALSFNSNSSIISGAQISQFITWIIGLFTCNAQEGTSSYDIIPESFQRSIEATEPISSPFVLLEEQNSFFWSEIFRIIITSLTLSFILWFLVSPLLEPGSIRMLLRDLKKIRGVHRKLLYIMSYFFAHIRTLFRDLFKYLKSKNKAVSQENISEIISHLLIHSKLLKEKSREKQKQLQLIQRILMSLLSWFDAYSVSLSTGKTLRELYYDFKEKNSQLMKSPLSKNKEEPEPAALEEEIILGTEKVIFQLETALYSSQGLEHLQLKETEKILNQYRKKQIS